MRTILAELSLDEALLIAQSRMAAGTLIGQLDSQRPAPAPRDSVRDAAPS